MTSSLGNSANYRFFIQLQIYMLDQTFNANWLYHLVTSLSCLPCEINENATDAPFLCTVSSMSVEEGTCPIESEGHYTAVWPVIMTPKFSGTEPHKVKQQRIDIRNQNDQ